MDNSDAVVDEIQLLATDEGLAVLGPSPAVEQFLAAENLPSSELRSSRLHQLMSTGSGVADAGAQIAENSGRWVKLSEESAAAVKKFGLRESSTSGLSSGVIRGEKGRIKGYVEFARGPGPGTKLTNPSVLAGAAGIMAQLAMQQAMTEVTDYLKSIDTKLDDVLRAQKDSVVAKLLGAGFVIDEAMTVRQSRGKVDNVTWSKVQNVPQTIAEVQGYALGQLDALARKVEQARSVAGLGESVRESDVRAGEWLAVLARTVQLQDGIAVLELDRVLDSSPDEIDGHRLGLRAARQDRLQLISTTTVRLVARVAEASGTANDKVLLHPTASPAVVRSSGSLTGAIVEFHNLLGLTAPVEELSARRWSHAVADVRDKALESGTGGARAVQRRGGAAYGKAKAQARRTSSTARGHLPTTFGRRLRREAQSDGPRDDGES